MDLFRELDADEEERFRVWARDNYVHKSLRNDLWHPVVLDEMDKIDKAREGGV